LRATQDEHDGSPTYRILDFIEPAISTDDADAIGGDEELHPTQEQPGDTILHPLGHFSFRVHVTDKNDRFHESHQWFRRPTPRSEAGMALR
jgi:hypothetical protein